MPDKKLVFDATVLSNFFLADAVPLLIKRYHHRGIVTWEVYDELSAGFNKLPFLRRIESLLAPRHFNLITLSPKEHVFYASLLDSFGKGEASCIAIARSSHHVVATDDKAARRQCEIHGISYTGTIGILVASCREGQTTSVEADRILHYMIRAGFYSPVRKISDVA
jgi:predicted nucleic acid-binding protein